MSEMGPCIICVAITGSLPRKANNPAVLSYKITSLLRDPKRLEQIRANVKRVARPRAAFDVVAKSLELIRK